MRYWFNTLLGIGLAAAAVAVVAWCSRALVERSLCAPASEQLACSADAGALGTAIGVCLLIAIPLASTIFSRRTRPRGTPLGLLALGLSLLAGGGAALQAALANPGDTTVQAIGFGCAAPALIFGTMMTFSGFVLTASRIYTSPIETAAAAAREAAAGVAAQRSSSGAVFLSGADIRAGAIDDATRARAAATTSGFGALAAQLAQVAAAKERTGAGALAATLRQLDDLHAAGLLNSADHARMRDEINARVREL